MAILRQQKYEVTSELSPFNKHLKISCFPKTLKTGKNIYSMSPWPWLVSIKILSTILILETALLDASYSLTNFPDKLENYFLEAQAKAKSEMFQASNAKSILCT